MALNEIHHIAAIVAKAAARTTPSAAVQGRWVAAPTRLATDSPRTIKRNVPKRSGRCDTFVGAARATPTLSHGPAISASIATAPSTYLAPPASASEPSQRPALKLPAST